MKSVLHSALRWFLPAEIVVAIALVTAVLVHKAAGMRLYSATVLALELYGIYLLVPLFLSMILVMYIRVIYHKRRQHGSKSSLSFFHDLARPLFCLLACAYFCYLFKLWSHLWTHRNYDALFAHIDTLIPGMRFMHVAAQWLDKGDSYIITFIMSFWLVVPSVFWLNIRQYHRLVLALCVNMISGGLGFSLMPAFGPFIYGATHPAFRAQQQQMLHFTTVFRNSNGMTYSPDMFMLSLGAMPSFHISLTVILMYYAWKTSRGVGIMAFFFVAYIFVQANNTGFHYVVDEFAGIVLALISIYVSNFVSAPYEARIAVSQ